MLTIITTIKDIAKYRNQRQRTIDIDMTIIDMQKVIIELITYMQKITGIQMTEDTQIAVDHQNGDMCENQKKSDKSSMIIEKAIIKPWEP
jgi:hypothetical protein